MRDFRVHNISQVAEKQRSSPKTAALTTPKGEFKTEQVPPNPAGSKTEIGGPSGLEPTRYGDWEVDGIVSDF